MAWYQSRLVLSILGVAAASTLIAVTVHASIFQQPRAASADMALVATASGVVGASAASSAAPSTAPAPTRQVDQQVTIYSGRGESLIGDLIRQFSRDTGIKVNIKYGNTGHLAALILEEDQRSPADVFLAQDPGGLGLLATRDRLARLPDELLGRVPYQFRDPEGRWIGITGRLRTIAYSTERMTADELPASILELTDSQWSGRVGWAPSNASFQALITAMRHELGERATERWLRDMIANNVRVYPRNTPIIQAIADREIDLGLVNHYYLHRFRAERGDSFPVRNHVPVGTAEGGDLGGTMLVSGIGVLTTASNDDAAQRFIAYLLSEKGQRYFAEKTFEYPMANGVTPHDDVPDLSQVQAHTTNLTDLSDLEATVALLRKVGALR